MIIDTSAIIAILRNEPEYSDFVSCLTNSKESKHISAASLLETGIVLGAGNSAALDRQLTELIENFGIEINAVNEQQAWAAIKAHRTYGRGSGHRARLNFGDCFSYALAKDRSEPLLYKGKDFAQTDIKPAL